MIPILITLAKNKILKAISWLKGNYKAMAVIIIMVLTAFCFYLNNLLKLKSREIDRITNNYLYYEELATKLSNTNRVLLLTIDEYKETKDSLIQLILTTLKELKIKEKELQQVLRLELTILHDTTIIVKEPNFEVEIKPNSLTSIIIAKKDSMLTHKLDIRNTLILYIQKKKEYKRSYRNWFCRLLHFDFKRITTNKYQIHNTNELIRVEDTRIIELTK